MKKTDIKEAPKNVQEPKTENPVAEAPNTDKEAKENKIPERLTISSKLLNDMLGILSILPAYQIMELITKVQMDLSVSPTLEEIKEVLSNRKK